jgi:trypsin
MFLKCYFLDCVDGFNISRMSVFAGTNDLRKEDEGTRIRVEDCQIHPEYVELNNSDVAVCRLRESFTFSEKIEPITLSEEYIGGDETCLLTGWGYTTMIRGFPLPNELQRANLTSLTNEDCNSRGHNVGPREICTLTHLGQGACGGYEKQT